MTGIAVYPQETIGQDAAVEEGSQFFLHKPGDDAIALALPGQESREMAGHNTVEHALFRPPRTVLAGGFAHGKALAAKYKIAPFQLYVSFENRCRVRAAHSPRSTSCGPVATL